MMYQMAAYCRLSKDDGENKISESIENQLKLIREYVSKSDDLEIAEIYIDDGYSGLYFANRPEFQRMMEDIYKGKIQGVITKDISRLGREHIETSNYRVYTGAMVQHKSEKISYKVEKYHYIPEEQQYIVEGMHESIISKDTFEQAQQIMKRRTRTPGFHSEIKKVNPYAGILVCGDCGYNLQRVSCRDGYECGSYHKKGNTFCYSHFIKKETLDSIVKNEIQRQAKLALKESDEDEILKAADRRKEVERRCEEADQRIERLQKELAGVQKYKKKTYENYVDGVLDKEEYLSYKAEYEKQDQDIREKIRHAEQEKDNFEETEESFENWIEKFIKYGTLSEVTREIVTEVIDRIVVSRDKSIDIVFKYQSPYPSGKQAV